MDELRGQTVLLGSRLITSPGRRRRPLRDSPLSLVPFTIRDLDEPPIAESREPAMQAGTALLVVQ
jgi:hypothetical protein